MYEISITLADGTKHEMKTDTVEAGLSQYKPEFIKGKLVVDVKNEMNGKTANKVVFVPAARRMFYNPMALQIFSRNLERALI